MKAFSRSKIIASLAGLAFIAFYAPNTSAAPATSLPSWTGVDNYVENGAAWYHYEFTGDKEYGDDDVIYLPFENNDNNEHIQRTAIPAKTCKEYGGFMVLLANGKDGEQSPYSAVRVSDMSVSDKSGYSYIATDNISYKNPNLSGQEKDGIKLVETLDNFKKGLDEYNNLKDTSAVPDYANNELGALRYFCYGSAPDSQQIPLTSFSTVSVKDNSINSAPVKNGTSYLSNSLVVTAGEQINITFHHYIAKGTDRGLKEGSISYTIDGESGSVSVNDLNKNSKVIRDSTNYYAVEITKGITVTASEKQTYCQTIKFTGSYNSASFNLDNGGDEHTSTACVTIDPIVSMANVVTDCDYKGDGLFRNDEFFGNTVASVGITKNNELKPENVTTAAARDDAVTVFAKPGDIVQFSYALCFGAHSVRDLSAKDAKFLSGDNVDNEGKIMPDNELSNRFKVSTDNTSDEEGSGYLFGRADALLGDTVMVSNADARQKDLKKTRDGTARIEVPCTDDEPACKYPNYPHVCENPEAFSNDVADGIKEPIDDASTYRKGDMAIYAGAIYEAQSDIPAGMSIIERSVWDEESKSWHNYEELSSSWKLVNMEVPQCGYLNTTESTDSSDDREAFFNTIGGSFFNTQGQGEFFSSQDYYDIQKDKNEVLFASPDSKVGAKRFEVKDIIGSTLKQTLTYNYLAFWPSKLCQGSACFGCGVNDNINNSAGICVFGTLKNPSYDTDPNIAERIRKLQEQYGPSILEELAAGNVPLDIADRGLFELGWDSNWEKYKIAVDYSNRGDVTIPSDAYNIGFGAYGRDEREESVYKSAEVVVPYNFDTNLTMEMNDYPEGTIYPGDTINIKAKIDILPRENPLTSSVDENNKFVPYATATPPNTKVNLIELLIPEDVNIDNDKVYKYHDGEKEHAATLKQILDGDVDPYNKSSICKQYSSFLGDDLGECRAATIAGNASSFKKLPYAEQLTRVGNADSNPAGEMGYFDTEKEYSYQDEYDNTQTKKINELKRVAPDAEAGYKYCVAIGINHGDSHNASGKILSDAEKLEDGTPNPLYAANEYSVSSSIGGNIPYSWKVSKFSCRTIIKKPTFQVWNGGVYSGGNISGAVYYKTVNTKINLNKMADDPLYANKEKYIAPGPVYFGSWAEYFIISRSNVMGVASASALGYTSPTNTWYTKILDQSGQDTLRRRAHESYFADTGVQTSTINNNFCSLAYLTIANTACKKDEKGGNYTGNNDSSDETFLEDFKQRIINYYTNSELTVGNEGVISGGTYEGQGLPYANQNGADYLKVNGNYSINAPIARNIGDKTLIIEVDGTLNINRNICLLDDAGTCQNGSSDNWKNNYDQNTNWLSLLNRNGRDINTGGLSDIPQIILIAENINIAPAVTQIDSWLITNSRDEDYDGGYINTCAEFKNDKTGTDECWRTLKVNAPVVTSALFLNRTGGAWPGYSGDVGNQAYDTLKNKMRNEIEQEATRIVDTLVANEEEVIARKDDPSYSPFSLDDHYHPLGTVEISRTTSDIKNYFASCREVSETTIDGCVKKKIVKRLKTLYPKAISPNNPDDPMRKAYENAANYYAAWDNYSGWDNNQIDPSKNDAKTPFSRDLTCDGTITPAEIFDLNPLVYYWALAESQKNNKAFITYAQEFAPRY